MIFIEDLWIWLESLRGEERCRRVGDGSVLRMGMDMGGARWMVGDLRGEGRGAEMYWEVRWRLGGEAARGLL